MRMREMALRSTQQRVVIALMNAVQEGAKRNWTHLKPNILSKYLFNKRTPMLEPYLRT